MLQASSERQAAGAAARLLWVPGMSPQPVDEGSARAQEIARRREELLGMLHDLPESEYELSFTDLVEKAGTEAATATAAAPSEGKEAGGQVQIQQQPAATGKPEWRRRQRRDSGSVGGSSFRSSSDGVLLNFYMPRSLTRSFTAPRPSRTPSVRAPSVSSAAECNNRERDADADTVKCWSLLWDRRWRKSSRRERYHGAPPSESTIRAASAAILKGAKHTAAPLANL